MFQFFWTDFCNFSDFLTVRSKIPCTVWVTKDSPGVSHGGLILYAGFLTVHSKNPKNSKNRSRKIGTSKKYEKQKCDLQFAPTGLNDFHIEIPSILMDFLYTTPGPILGALGGPRAPPRGPKFSQICITVKIPSTVGRRIPQGDPRALVG